VGSVVFAIPRLYLNPSLKYWSTVSVTPCSLIQRYKAFRGTCDIPRQGSWFITTFENTQRHVTQENKIQSLISFSWLSIPNGLRPPLYWGFVITLRHTPLGRTPLDDGSAYRWDFYLTTHNTHKRETFMLSEGFEPAISASERPQTHVLDRAVTRINEMWKQDTYSISFAQVSLKSNSATR